MTEDKISGSSSSRPRSSRSPIIIDQEPTSSSVEKNAETNLPVNEAASDPKEAEAMQTSESSVTPDNPLDEASMDSPAVKDAASQSEPSWPASKSRGVGTLVLAVIAGGIAGAAVNGLMPLMFPPANNLETRLTTVERSLVTVPRRVDVDALVQSLDDLRRQNVVLGGRLGALEEQAASVVSGATSEQSSQGQAVSGEAAAELATLQERLGRLDELIAGLNREQTATADQMRDIERTVAAQNSLQIQSEQRAIAQRLSELEASVRAKLGAFDPTSVVSRIDTQATEISRLGTRLAAAEGELIAVERRALAMEASNSERLVVVARLAVLERLRNALEEGKPFAGEIETLAKLGVSGASVNALQAAANGVATPQSLAGPFTKAAAEFEAEAIPADASLMDKLAATAADIVRVRHVDSEPDARDLAGQTELFLKSNNASAALSVWERLPQSARDKTKDLAAALQTRVNAQTALAALMQYQVQALGASAAVGTLKGE